MLKQGAMQCLIDLSNSEQMNENAKCQVMQSMSALVSSKACTLELIELNQIHKVCEVFDKNAKL